MFQNNPVDIQETSLLIWLLTNIFKRNIILMFLDCLDFEFLSISKYFWNEEF